MKMTFMCLIIFWGNCYKFYQSIHVEPINCGRFITSKCKPMFMGSYVLFVYLLFVFNTCTHKLGTPTISALYWKYWWQSFYHCLNIFFYLLSWLFWLRAQHQLGSNSLLGMMGFAPPAWTLVTCVFFYSFLPQTDMFYSLPSLFTSSLREREQITWLTETIFWGFKFHSGCLIALHFFSYK